MATLSRLLGVSRSGYYAWRMRPPSARACAAQELTRHIRAVHQQCRGTDGALRIWAERRDRGVMCSRKQQRRARVAQVMEPDSGHYRSLDEFLVRLREGVERCVV